MANRFENLVSQFKAYIITEELLKYKGNISKTAAALGMHRNSLSRNMAEHGVELKEIKAKMRGSNEGFQQRRSELHQLSDHRGSGSEGSLPCPERTDN